MEEGEIWEAAMAAAHYRLDNLTVFLDYNGLQIDGPTSQVMSSEPVEDKWRAFRWNVLNIDGHDFEQILAAIELAKGHRGQPTIIIARTIKGKGVSFMENAVGWHGNAPTREQAERALAELGGQS
jgi:transketolase